MSSKKENIPLGVRQEFDDIDYWHKLSKTKLVKLPDGSTMSEYAYMKRFMHEAYANNFDRKNNKNNILKTKKQKQWATRNNNNTNRDVLNIIKKSGKIATLFHVSEADYKEEAEPWEDKLNTSTYEDAAIEMLKQSCEELALDYDIDTAKNLLRNYFRVKKFIRMIRLDMKNQKKRCTECNKSRLKNEYSSDKRTKDKLKTKCNTCEETNVS